MQPLLFEPILKRIRWGGRRLGTVLGKPIGPGSDYAESWEVCDHGKDQSVVKAGPYVGQTLSHLLDTQNLPLLGRAAGRSQFPLLVKYLDARDALSLQVHPNDEQALSFDPDENGKSEAWIVLDAAPDSRLYCGFREGVSQSQVRDAIATGRIETLLHTIDVQPGACVYVPAGTVHAIGGGVLLAEVQQSSDITFRLFDWDRLGSDGQPRSLQIPEALECIDFDRGPVDPVIPQRLPADHVLEELVRCEYFVILRHASDTSFSIPVDQNCHVVMVVDGAATLTLTTSNDQMELPLGQTIVLPAEREEVVVTPLGHVTILDAFLPPDGGSSPGSQPENRWRT